MGLYINSSASSLLLGRSLYQASAMQNNIMKRLSSGIKINSASDDAAGLSLSEKLKSVINGNTVAKNNAQTGISMLNTADSALSMMTTSLERIRNLAVQAANGVYSNSERQMLQTEVSQMSADIQQSYKSAKFSGKNIFEGDSSGEAAAAIAAGYNDAHIITGAADLVSKIQTDMGGSFILAADIDLAALGTKTNSIITGNFTGTLEGGGHTISNFNIDTGGAAVDNIGLFSQISGTVKNLAIRGFTVNATNSYYTGGLVGLIDGGTVENCSVNGTMNTYMTSGLLAGENDGGQVLSCSSEGSLTGTGWSASGLVGWNAAGGLVSKSYSSATIVNNGGEGDAGGVVGYNDGATVSECYFSGSATSLVSTFANVGGVVACNDMGIITNCYSTGDARVTGAGSGKIGGIVGANWAGGSVSKCYAAGTVIGTNPLVTGGVVGSNSGSVDNTNFYQNNQSTDAGSSVNGNINPLPTGTWDTNIWDLSSTPPTLKDVGATLEATIESTTQLQIGDDANDTSQINILKKYVLGNIDFNVTSASEALSTIEKVEAKLSELNSYRSGIGADTNKLTSILNILDSRITNTSESKSTIYDADMAKESANMVKTQIRTQASTSLLAQVKGLDANLLMQLLQ